MSKYSLLKEQLLREDIIAPTELMAPESLSMHIMGAVHTAEYLTKLQSSSLSSAETRRLGLPWSEQLWRRSRMVAGGTLLAAHTALRDGMAANLAGGTHHAFADHGEGFCVINDVAIAVCQLRETGLLERATIIDLDVHQGNGTAAIFETNDAVFTFSMHGERNYPLAKMRSSLDVPLDDGTGDSQYLDVLDRHLHAVLDHAAPELAFYVAGVDVAAGDRYGKLALSDDGIRQRDRMVIEAVRGRGVPLVVVLAGGYAPTRARTAELHSLLFREAAAYERNSIAIAGQSADRV